MKLFRNKESLNTFSICAITIGPSINFFSNVLIKYVIGGRSISSTIYMVLALFGLMSYELLLGNKYKNNKVVITIIVTFFLLLISGLIHPSIWHNIISDDFNPLGSVGLFLVFYGFPVMILCSEQKKWDLLLKYMYYFSIVDIVLATIVYFRVMIPFGMEAVNYMSFSYNQLLSASVCAVYGYKNKSVIAYGVSAISLILIFLGGARGTLGCLLFLYILLSINKISFRKAIAVMILFFVVFSFGVNKLFDVFLTTSGSYVDNLGGFSRTLYLMTQGDLLESSGRDDFHSIIQDAIVQNPLGYGMLGDRYVLGQHGGEGYAHNLIWEFLCDFGLIFGGVLFFALVYGMLRVYKKCKEMPVYYCFLAMLPAGFIMLFMSGSFLEEFAFWALLGVLYNTSSKSSRSIQTLMAQKNVVDIC